jgi:hypothetical protein
MQQPRFIAPRPFATLLLLSGLALTGVLSGPRADPVAAFAQKPAQDKGSPRQSAGQAQFTGPRYTARGEFILPDNYKSWIFVGANLGIEYGQRAQPKPNDDAGKPAKTGNFHHVYIDPAAFEHFARTGEFPEKTVLMLDIYEARGGEPGGIVSEGLFPGKAVGVAAAVKNRQRPDGLKTNWAYYDFGLDNKPAKAFANSACYDCHLEHASDDNVWVQFYPTLLELKQKIK